MSASKGTSRLSIFQRTRLIASELGSKSKFISATEFSESCSSSWTFTRESFSFWRCAIMEDAVSAVLKRLGAAIDFCRREQKDAN